MTEPDWFRAAIAVTPERHEVTVDGCVIRYRRWGNRDPWRSSRYRTLITT